MKKLLSIVFTLAIFNVCFSLSNKDSISKKNHPFFIEGFGIYWYNSAMNMNDPDNKKLQPNFTVSLGYTFKKSLSKRLIKAVQISYIFYNDEELANYGSYGYFSNGSSPNNHNNNNNKYIKRRDSISSHYQHSRTILWSLSPEIKIVLSRKNKYQGFLITAGVGICQRKSFSIGNFLYEKKDAWNVLGSLGYKISLGRIFFEGQIGAGFFFTYKKYNYNQHLQNVPAIEYDDFVQQSSDTSIEGIEIQDTYNITYTYKRYGIMHPEFFPRLSLNFGLIF